MSGKNKQQKDLEQLKRFILQPPVQDHISYLWYYSLRARYPFQYLQLMKQFRNRQKGNMAIKSDKENISEAIQWINHLYGDLSRFFLNPPENEEQERSFMKKVSFLEELLIKQSKEN
jgi:hypothetical protein